MSCVLKTRPQLSVDSVPTEFLYAKCVKSHERLKTLRTQHKDKGGDAEDTYSAKELDVAPTLRPPGEPHPPPQRYFMHNSKDKN